MDNQPKLVIVSDGTHTAALLDGVFLGPGIRHLEFMANATSGKPEAIIRLLDVDVEKFCAKNGTEEFSKFFRLFAKE